MFDVLITYYVSNKSLHNFDYLFQPTLTITTKGSQSYQIFSHHDYADQRIFEIDKVHLMTNSCVCLKLQHNLLHLPQRYRERDKAVKKKK